MSRYFWSILTLAVTIDLLILLCHGEVKNSNPPEICYRAHWPSGQVLKLYPLELKRNPEELFASPRLDFEQYGRIAFFFQKDRNNKPYLGMVINTDNNFPNTRQDVHVASFLLTGEGLQSTIPPLAPTKLFGDRKRPTKLIRGINEGPSTFQWISNQRDGAIWGPLPSDHDYCISIKLASFHSKINFNMGFISGPSDSASQFWEFGMHDTIKVCSEQCDHQWHDAANPAAHRSGHSDRYRHHIPHEHPANQVIEFGPEAWKSQQTYVLRNPEDAGFGLKLFGLDGVYGSTSFFDFNHPMSKMRITVSPEVGAIAIYGTAKSSDGHVYLIYFVYHDAVFDPVAYRITKHVDTSSRSGGWIQMANGIRRALDPAPIVGMPLFVIEKARSGEYLGIGSIEHNNAPFMAHGSEWRFKIAEEKDDFSFGGPTLALRQEYELKNTPTSPRSAMSIQGPMRALALDFSRGNVTMTLDPHGQKVMIHGIGYGNDGKPYIVHYTQPLLGIDPARDEVQTATESFGFVRSGTGEELISLTSEDRVIVKKNPTSGLFESTEELVLTDRRHPFTKLKYSFEVGGVKDCQFNIISFAKFQTYRMYNGMTEGNEAYGSVFALFESPDKSKFDFNNRNSEMLFTYDPGFGTNQGKVTIEGQAVTAANGESQPFVFLIRYEGVSVDVASRKLTCRAPMCHISGWVKTVGGVPYYVNEGSVSHEPLLNLEIDKDGVVLVSGSVFEQSSNQILGKWGFHIGECVDEIDECLLGTHECDPRVPCINAQNGYMCGPCPPPLVGDGRNCYYPSSDHPPVENKPVWQEHHNTVHRPSSHETNPPPPPNMPIHQPDFVKREPVIMKPEPPPPSLHPPPAPQPRDPVNLVDEQRDRQVPDSNNNSHESHAPKPRAPAPLIVRGTHIDLKPVCITRSRRGPKILFSSHNTNPSKLEIPHGSDNRLIIEVQGPDKTLRQVTAREAMPPTTFPANSYDERAFEYLLPREAVRVQWKMVIDGYDTSSPIVRIADLPNCPTIDEMTLNRMMTKSPDAWWPNGWVLFVVVCITAGSIVLALYLYRANRRYHRKYYPKGDEYDYFGDDSEGVRGAHSLRQRPMEDGRYRRNDRALI